MPCFLDHDRNGRLKNGMQRKQSHIGSYPPLIYPAGQISGTLTALTLKAYGQPIALLKPFGAEFRWMFTLVCRHRTAQHFCRNVISCALLIRCSRVVRHLGLKRNRINHNVCSDCSDSGSDGRAESGRSPIANPRSLASP
jgi:hypothetical protein